MTATDYSGAGIPVVQLYWPQDGTQVSGSQFILRGRKGVSSCY